MNTLWWYSLHVIRLQLSIILFINANDHLPTSSFQRFQQDGDLINIIAKYWPEASTAIHTSGNIIEYIMLWPNLAAGIIASGILPLNHHVVSDNQASYCDIGVNALFSVTKIDELIYGTRRKLQMSKPSVVAKYLDKLEPLYNEHKRLQRIQDLIQLFEDTTKKITTHHR